jgi:hypothetical protein
VDRLGPVNLDDLSEHIAAVSGEAALELPYAGKVYMAPQPGLTRGVRCTQYLAAATREEKLAVLAEANVDNLPDLTLTRAVVDQMDVDDVPITAVTTLAHVALVAWVRGPKVAERYVAGLLGNGGEASGEATSGSRSRKRTGTATASARRTRKPASGRTTASPPAS